MAIQNEPGCDTGLNFKACSITLTFAELIALKAQLLMGKMWTPPEHRKQIQKLLDRIAVKLAARGFETDVIETLTKL